MHFSKLDDSPMFRQQIHCLEESADVLREKCLKLFKGCRKYTEGIGEGYDGDIGFVSALETFGGGHNDPISVAFGEPVMNKFAIALREIGTYKEVLRLQVEHMLNDRLQKFVVVDMYDVKEARKRFDKATLIYDQAREKFLSLRKSARMDIATVLEEELRSARSRFEQARFNLVSSLSNIEAKKRFEFLEAVSGAMAAHLHYFKQGYELLHQMEPLINQVLAYAQQSRESFYSEQESLNEQMQEYQRQIDRDSRRSANGYDGSPKGEGMQSFARSSHKEIEAVMESASKGKVQTIRQGYLSKRSSNLRGDWKRRFFVLDSRGMLYYYRKQWSRSSVAGPVQKNIASEHGSGLLNRWRSSHYHGGVNDEKSVACHTVNLLTSTIKIDADQSDLRFCFRIISPSKIYALQAESAVDQMDWIEKITGVIASLLNSQTPERVHHLPASRMGWGDHDSSRESSTPESDFDQDQTAIEEYTSRIPVTKNHLRLSRSHQQLHSTVNSEKPIDVLRRVGGNDKCADCGSPEPDWASLNLGVLICIECSGVHRNLGVHISKVRSLTLDVKVWEPSVIILFQSLGNDYANSIWEELLNSRGTFQYDDVPLSFSKFDKHKLFLMSKPSPDDHISMKEKFINAKYAEKLFVRRIKDNQHHSLVSQRVWESVRINDKKGVYRYIVNSEVGVNSIHGKASFGGSLDKASSIILNSANKSEDQLLEEHFDGCSLLHLASQTADVGMVELLLQYGANINASDSRGQTPLHHCIIRGKTTIIKVLLTRGADPKAVDSEGKTPLQLAIDSAFDDNEVLVLLRDTNR